MKSEKIRSVIIDDDPFMQELLKDKLELHTPDVEIMGIAGSGTEGIALVEKQQPDLVFLDVEMTDMTGFEMLSQIPDINFRVIFVTSYNHYAVKAIRFDALDYLQKPIDLGELKSAIRRYKKNAGRSLGQSNLQNAVNNFKAGDPGELSLLLQLQDGEKLIKLKDIIYIEGERNYSYIHCQNQPKILTSKTLGSLEDNLVDKGFFRCHKSYIINSVHIAHYHGGNTMKLKNEQQLPVSRRKIAAFREWYEKSD